jgi:UDP-N-acetyl-D-mannosaminuronic acid transferase (WecB/TagA/CpsF family)
MPGAPDPTYIRGQRAGFGWLFRLIVQPWRWRRQLALPRLVAAVIAKAIIAFARRR